MSSSANRLLPGLAAAAGIGAFALPLVAPWHLLTLITAAIIINFTASGWLRVIIGGISFVTVLLVFQGMLSAPLAVACLSSFVLAKTDRLGIAIGVLALNLTTVASAQELLGNQLHSTNLEAAAPATLVALVLVLTSTTKVRAVAAIGFGLLAYVAVWAASRMANTPEAVLAAGAAPVTLAATIFGTIGPTPRRTSIPIAAIIFAALAAWTWTIPRATTETWLLLPEAPEAYEAKFFDNYAEALHFAGVVTKSATTADEIPANATVLIPWFTAAFQDEQRIGDLARERRWTVVLGGEHTDMGRIATRIKSMTGQSLLRNDLSTPRHNTDDSGPMRIAEVGAWPHESIFNRGASVSIASLTDKVLLAGDGWWAEPNIGEWLWVGDYVWRRGDRAGRLAMIAASDIGGARWIVMGDNSPMVNRQLIADPRPAIRILQAATLWPAFLADLLVIVAAAALTFNATSAIAIALPTAATFVTILLNQTPQAWKDYYLGESGFDERNFNNVLSNNPSLFVGRRLIRIKLPVSHKIALPDGSATMFMLVNGAVDISGTRVDHCRRMGSLVTAEGPHLMDAQACRVTGEARVLIGTEDAAAAFSVGTTLIVLDVAFLGQKAPLSNTAWLLKEIGR